MDAGVFLNDGLADVRDKFSKRDDKWIKASSYFAEYFLMRTLEEFKRLKDDEKVTPFGYLEIDLNIDGKWGKLNHAIEESKHNALVEYIEAIKSHNEALCDLGTDEIAEFEKFASKEAISIARKLYALLPLEAAGKFSSSGISDSEREKLELATLIDYYCCHAENMLDKIYDNPCEDGKELKLSRPEFFDKTINFFLKAYGYWQVENIETKHVQDKERLKKFTLESLRKDGIDKESEIYPDNEMFEGLYKALKSFLEKLKLEVDVNLRLKTKNTEGSVKPSQIRRVSESELYVHFFAIVNFAVGLLRDSKFIDSRQECCRLSSRSCSIAKGAGEDYFKGGNPEKTIELMGTCFKVLARKNGSNENFNFSRVMCCWFLLQNNLLFQTYYWHKLLMVILDTDEGKEIFEAIDTKPEIFKPTFHKLVYLENICNARHNFLGEPKYFSGFDIVNHLERYTNLLETIKAQEPKKEIAEIMEETAKLGDSIGVLLDAPILFYSNLQFAFWQKSTDSFDTSSFKANAYSNCLDSICKYYCLMYKASSGKRPCISIKNLISKMRRNGDFDNTWVDCDLYGVVQILSSRFIHTK